MIYFRKPILDLTKGYNTKISSNHLKLAIASKEYSLKEDSNKEITKKIVLNNILSLSDRIEKIINIISDNDRQTSKSNTSDPALKEEVIEISKQLINIKAKVSKLEYNAESFGNDLLRSQKELTILANNYEQLEKKHDKLSKNHERFLLEQIKIQARQDKFDDKQKQIDKTSKEKYDTIDSLKKEIMCLQKEPALSIYHVADVFALFKSNYDELEHQKIANLCGKILRENNINKIGKVKSDKEGSKQKPPVYPLEKAITVICNNLPRFAKRNSIYKDLSKDELTPLLKDKATYKYSVK